MPLFSDLSSAISCELPSSERKAKPCARAVARLQPAASAKRGPHAHKSIIHPCPLPWRSNGVAYPAYHRARRAAAVAAQRQPRPPPPRRAPPRNKRAASPPLPCRALTPRAARRLATRVRGGDARGKVSVRAHRAAAAVGRPAR
eukprot:4947315-Prymnesium_polylepis.1